MRKFLYTILFAALFGINDNHAATIDISANTLWSAIVTGSGPGGVPDLTDDIFVHGGVSLTVDIAGAEANTLTLGSATLVPTGNGTLVFDPGSSLTTAGLISLGDLTQRGIIDMTNGGYLTTAGTILTGNANRATLTAGTGTIEYTGTFLLPNSNLFNNFNIVIFNGATVTTDVTTTFNGDFTMQSGSTFNKANAIVFNANATLDGTWNNTAGGNITANSTVEMESGLLYNTDAGVTATMTVSGDLTVRGVTIQRNLTGNGRFIVLGNCIVESGTTTNGGGRFEVQGQMDIQAGASFDFNIDASGNFRSVGSLNMGNGSSLTFSGVAITLPVAGNLFMDGGTISGVSTGSGVTVAGSATINSGTNIIAGQTFTVATDLNILSGATLTFNNTNGTKSFNNINVSNGGTWNSAVSRTYTITGSLLNDGTFTANSGQYTLTGSAQTIGGSNQISIPTFRINGAGSSYTNNGSLRIGSSWTGNGDLTNGSNAQLDFGGTLTSSGVLDASAADNTVLYSSSIAQTMRSITYHHLSISNAGTTSATGAVTINGDLTILGGTVDFAAPVTGNATGQINMSASTRLELSSTCLDFPTGYVTANITLDPSSTVRYEATNALQTISIAPVYGNLEIAQTGGGGVTKTLASAGTLTIATDLTITSPTTLNLAANTMTLGGDYNGTGNLTIGTGIFNIAGDWSNSGTFTKGTSTVNWNSASTQTIVAKNFHHLTSSSTGDRILASSGTIGISGDFTPGINSYTITGSTVSFNGTTAQTVPAFTFYNHTISNAAGVSLAGNVDLERTLTLSSGLFTTTGFTYTLLSDATYTARIATITGGSISGPITQQRYAPGPTTGWCLLGSPINGTIASWTDDFPTSGFPGSAGWAGGFISVYTYDETAPGLLDEVTAYDPITNATNALTVGTGYWVYLGDGQVNTSDITIDVTGPPQTGTFTFTTSFTSSGGLSEDGWNLVANPFPSAIDWDAASGWTKTRVDDAIYMYQADNGQYASYVAGVGTNGGTQYIASSQGFYVKTNAASPLLRATEAVKTANDPTLLRTETSASIGNLIRFELSDLTNNKKDETVLRIHPDATDDYDGSLDALKFYASPDKNSSISLVGKQKEYSIYSTNALRGKKLTLPVYVTTSNNGTYHIRFQVQYMTAPYCVKLIDLLTGDITPVSNGSEYTFDATIGKLTDRFLLSMESPDEPGVLAGTCEDNNLGSILLNGELNSDWEVTVKNENQTSYYSGKMQSRTIDLLPNGDYTISYKHEGCGTLSETMTLENAPAVAARFSLKPLTSDTWLFTIEGNEQGIYTWSFSDGTEITTREKVTTHQFLQPGSATVTLTVDNGTCSHSKTILLGTDENEQVAHTYGVRFNDDKLQINSGWNNGIMGDVYIYTADGSLVFRQNQYSIQPGGNTLPIPSLASGIYMVQIKSAIDLFQQKLLR